MILKFPNLDTLRLALTSGAVPPALAQTAAVAGLDDQQQVWVESDAPLPRAAQTDLRRLGVQLCKTSGTTTSIAVSCWPEILPLRPDAEPIDRLEQTPILFEVSDQDGLGRLVVEILRLGNDRQGFRWLEAKTDADEGRGLLRVVGPPYYSLLRAVDRNGQAAAPRAYRERAPRVWIEVGWMHPLADHLKPPTGKLLLASAPRQWTLIDDGPFRDVYEVMEFALPNAPSDWNEGALKTKIRPALRLTSGGSTDGAELWVLHDGAVEELNRFVQNSDEQMLHRLAFAVGEKDGRTIIVVRVRPSRLPPPELVLKAEAYKPYLKLPNLFLPAGQGLHPPLRRDMVRKLLADDSAQVVWLAPLGVGAFRPETLPEYAFRPLIDWIDYILDHEREPLEAWIQATQFDFEAFICDEDLAARPKQPPSERSGDCKKKEREGMDGPTSPDSETDDSSQRTEAKPDREEAFTVEKVEPSALQQQLRELEGRFTALEGGLDAPERQAMWPQLANLNAALGEHQQAGVCWLNALWAKESASETWAWNWFSAEASAGDSWASRLATASGKERAARVEELDRLLQSKETTSADLRALAAYLVWAVQEQSPLDAIRKRLNVVQRFLETNERLLPVRAVWLAWVHLVRLSGGDVLALARARDRLLERLFQNGLRPEQDLPNFLRFSGQATAQRFRGVGQWLLIMADKAHEWIGRQGSELTTRPDAQPRTRQYSDLLFAYALARLGEREASQLLHERAALVLGDEDLAHHLLLQGFEYRIKQAQLGKAAGGPLPQQLLRDVESLRHEYEAVKDRDKRPPDYSYMVERMREFSRVFEPHHKIDPYRHNNARYSEFNAAIALLPDISDKAEASERVQSLLLSAPKGHKGNEQCTRVVQIALGLAPRVSEEFARDMLDRAIVLLDALAPTNDLNALVELVIPLLEKALFVAAHFDSADHIQPLVGRFRRLLQAQGSAPKMGTLDVLTGQCFRGLRKLGMRDEVYQLLGETAAAILDGRSVGDGAVLNDVTGTPLRSLLHVAAEWLYFGMDQLAAPVLRAARAGLLADESNKPFGGREKAALAVAYVAAVGRAQPETTQARLAEVFDKVTGIRDAFLTHTHYGYSQLKVIEAVVLAVVSDDFTLGANARRWLDDDEYLVRRRIHRDYRAAVQL